MDMTDKYYTSCAHAFFNDTVDVDVSNLYQEFLPLLPARGRILDAGCGSARDSKHFKSLGHRICAFDANQKLVQLASKHLGDNVTQATFASFTAKPLSYDGIWACASLLHVPSCELTQTFNQLAQWLKPKGVFYCSFKYGSTELERNGRRFTDLNEDTLALHLINTELVIAKTWVTGDVREGRGSERWLNALLVKNSAHR